MLYRVPVIELKNQGISRRYSYTVVVMRYYPRFLAKALVDEYVRCLAPARELFTEFKREDRTLGDHDQAFARVRYEERFEINGDGKENLRRLSQLARARDVFLLCQCRAVERCHADLLLLFARHHFGADTQILRNKYPAFAARLPLLA